MTLSVSTAFVQITDPDAALEFYRDALGLTVYNDVANDGFRWITLGAPTQPGITVVLSNYVAGSPDDVRVMAELVAKGALHAVHFSAENLDATYAGLVAAGAEVVSEPADQPWGVRDCAVRDPSGNLLRIDQRR